QYRQRPRNGRLPGGHPQRAEAEDQEDDVEKGIADFGSRQQESKLERDMAADLKNREIVIVEAVVDVGFGQDDEKSDQPNSGQKVARGYDDRDGACVGINQQHHRQQRATDGLDGQHLTALAGTAPQELQ